MKAASLLVNLSRFYSLCNPFGDIALPHSLPFIITGIAVLLAAGFFGYMLALLQRRVGSIVSSQNVRTPPPPTEVPI